MNENTDNLKAEINQLTKEMNNLYKIQRYKINLSQELCSHNNIELDEGYQCYDDGEFIGYYPKLKCKDCGLVGHRNHPYMGRLNDDKAKEEYKKCKDNYRLLYDIAIKQEKFNYYFQYKRFIPLK